MKPYRHKPELLAPAGKKDVFYAVIEAGADAVYLSGKKFNMRRHRKDFHFTDEQLAECCNYAHEKGKRIYVVINSLLGDGEMNDLYEFLAYLEMIKVDALIIQDLAVAQVCREKAVAIELHSSTMMNVNSIESALFLKKHGFTRVVTSRDITIDEVRRIKEGAGIEVEYFVHGDMCSVQSGQCHASGLMFGKSANRGQCLKMCRWSYDLVSQGTGDVIKHDAYLLAAKDMTIIQHIPQFIQAGIDSFKIEGRMKSADVLVPIVQAYRAEIDAYLNNPIGHTRSFYATKKIFDNRIRNVSTGFSFGAPDNDFIDTAGDREPLFLSYSGGVKEIDDYSADAFGNGGNEYGIPLPELTCIAGTFDSACAAVKNGADNVILSWEGDLRISSGWQKDQVFALIKLCRDEGKKLLLSTPKILTERELCELYQTVDMYDEITTYAITAFSPIEFLKNRGKKLWAGLSCNILNSKSARFYYDAGIERIMPSQEASFETVHGLIHDNPNVSFDVLVHGTLTSMIIEHCLVAMNILNISKREFCKMPCHYDEYFLIDRAGNKRIIKTDRYCRNHIILEKELTVLPSLRSFMSLGAKSFRIDARTYSPEKTAFLVALFKSALEDGVQMLGKKCDALRAFYDGQNLTYGAYLKGIVTDGSKSLFELKKEEAHA